MCCQSVNTHTDIQQELAHSMEVLEGMVCRGKRCIVVVQRAENPNPKPLNTAQLTAPRFVA